ncbi:hypothetical protein NFI95_01400 [Acetobacteraceae bacterium KSS8]|uniref:Uncharacterized protein n=1 Tax=Endosaccharibacter trunci TaxID=2812733 RepID=A0ABT1W2L1_9PROT|nr:hypothetical protein [Acetobacteraceae bacterium KSS8]
MVFTVLIGAFTIILLAIVLFNIVGAIGRGVAKREAEPDPVIADSRDEFDLK